MQQNKIVSHDEWLDARKAHLAKEKQMTRLRDEVSAERRELPWMKVEKDYVFDTPHGKRTLSELFDGRSQLIIKHFMLAPGQKDGCVGCSFETDHIEATLQHLEQHDVTFVNVARAARRNRGLQEAHGLALQVGVVVRQRLQLRL